MHTFTEVYTHAVMPCEGETPAHDVQAYRFCLFVSLSLFCGEITARMHYAYNGDFDI